MKEKLSNPSVAGLITAIIVGTTTAVSVSTHYSADVLRFILSLLGG